MRGHAVGVPEHRTSRSGGGATYRRLLVTAMGACPVRDCRSARPGDTGEDEVHSVAGLVVAVGPEVAVGVEGLHGGLVAEAALNRFDRAALGDQERGVEMAEVVESGP